MLLFSHFPNILCLHTIATIWMSSSIHKQQQINVKPPGILIIARHGARLDYEARDAGWNWTQSSDRPHDPPLSETGHTQARALGDKIDMLLKEQNLKDVRVRYVYSSPLLRCCQTASGAMSRLKEIYELQKGHNLNVAEEEEIDACLDGLSRLRVEHGLMESVSLSWYSSWCLPQSDSTWGFHQKIAGWNEDSVQEAVSKNIVHNLALCEVSETLLSPEALIKQNGMRSLSIETDHEQVFDLNSKSYTWGSFESRHDNNERMKRIAQELLSRHPHECILLISHGGPTTHMYEALTQSSFDSVPLCRYTGTSIYINDGGTIKNLVVNV